MSNMNKLFCLRYHIFTTRPCMCFYLLLYDSLVNTENNNCVIELTKKYLIKAYLAPKINALCKNIMQKQKLNLP